MGLFNRREGAATEHAEQSPSSPPLGIMTAKEKAAGDGVVEEQRVTLLACLLGAVASVGGFIFGYVRSVSVFPRSRAPPPVTSPPPPRLQGGKG